MDEPLGEIPSLPAVLPTAEKSVAIDSGSGSLAKTENKWLDQALSGHTVEAAALRNELAKAHIKNAKADRRMRVKYAGRILLYLEFYSGGVLLLLLLTGFGLWGFKLEESEVSALVGSTALAAIGLVGFIARGLFRPPPPPSL